MSFELKYYFELKFEISAKLRFEWCITLYDSFWIYWIFPNSLYLHAYAKKNSLENTGKFKMNHIKLYIIRSAILRWFRIWGQNNIFAYAFKRKTLSKNLRGRIRKILRDLNPAWNSDSKYTHILQNCKSLALESLMAKK